MYLKKLWPSIAFALLLLPHLSFSQSSNEELLSNKDSILLTYLKTPALINSPISESSPLLNAIENLLVFNRSGGKKNASNKIFATQKIMGHWGNAQNITSDFSSIKNVKAVDINPDGQTIVLSGGKKQNDLFYAHLSNETWEKPIKFPETINSEWDEPYASLSYDERTLIFSSNRPKGFGGYDLYICEKKDNGEWGEVRNLGKTINSVRDEITPSLHTDGKSLYFSSNRRGTLGNFDIYFSKLNDKVWKQAQNIGGEINTKFDDAYFKMGINKKSAWWASNESKKTYDLKFVKITRTNRIPKEVVYTGLVYMEDYKPTENVEITISDADTKELIGEYRPNPVTGEYIYILEPERTYNILLTSPGYLGYTHDFYVPADSSYQIIHRSIELYPVKFFMPPQEVVEGDEFTTIKDILFGVNDAETMRYNKNLNNLADHLIKNVNCIIEIGGHTDETGDAVFNRKLSLERAQNVANYLMKKGVKKESFVIRNYGPNSPIAQNSKFKAKRFNRRVEFRILKQGDVKLMIQKIEVPKEYRVPTSLNSDK